MSEIKKPTIKQKIDLIKNHTENLKLRSDDHGHSCEDLRVYCENELYSYADEYIPTLINCFEKQQAVIAGLLIALESIDIRCTGDNKKANGSCSMIAREAIAKAKRDLGEV